MANPRTRKTTTKKTEPVAETPVDETPTDETPAETPVTVAGVDLSTVFPGVDRETLEAVQPMVKTAYEEQSETRQKVHENRFRVPLAGYRPKRSALAAQIAARIVASLGDAEVEKRIAENFKLASDVMDLCKRSGLPQRAVKQFLQDAKADYVEKGDKESAQSLAEIIRHGGSIHSLGAPKTAAAGKIVPRKVRTGLADSIKGLLDNSAPAADDSAAGVDK